MQTHATRTRLPLRTGAVSAQAGKFFPVLATITRAEDGRVLHARVNSVRLGHRRLEMPDTLEFPWVLRAIVELVCGQGRAGHVVGELVALTFGRAVRHIRFSGGR